jgi:hypothetical protein
MKFVKILFSHSCQNHLFVSFSDKYYLWLSHASRMCYMPCPLYPLWLFVILLKSTNYEAPHSAVSSVLPSICRRWTKFHTYRTRKTVVLCILIIRLSYMGSRDEGFWNEYHYSPNSVCSLIFPEHNSDLLLMFRKSLLEFCHFFGKFIGCVYIWIFSCAPVTRCVLVFI